VESVRVLGAVERELLAPRRAVEWGKMLSESEFTERNRRLYAHPFGKTRMRTYALGEGSELSATLDILDVKLLVRAGHGIQEQGAIHFASVLTLPECRGKGFGSRLLKEVLGRDKRGWATLFSGIGPGFYERLGFSASAHWERWLAAKPAEPNPALAVLPISVESFVGRQRLIKLQQLEARVTGAVFLPDALWWDWMADLYQFFGELKGVAVPRGRFYEGEYGGEAFLAAALENAVSQTFDVFWTSSTEPEVLAFFAGEANRLGMRAAHWWTTEEGWGKPQYPMIRAPAAAPLTQTSLGEWW
jgi:GNAT superfamily N-acetyltransferase